MRKEQFLEQKLEKSGATLKGIAGLITQSFEVEAMTGNGEHELEEKLDSIGNGLARNIQVNDGNGWNNDVHHDMSLTSYVGVHGGLHGTETSTSPIDILGYQPLKTEVDRLLDIYKRASANRVHHTVRGSLHVHNTVSYLRTVSSQTNSIKLDVRSIYDNIARFLLKFMPVMKWLTMTDYIGARGVRGSSYGDKFDRDFLFTWWSNYNINTKSDDSFEFLTSMGRGSCFRTYSRDAVHYENRLCDCTFNSTHISMWLSINKAITLFGIDFARNGFQFPLYNDEVEESKQRMYEHSTGYKNVNKERIEDLYDEMVSYLAKYLKVIGSLDAIEVMDKLIKLPISQYVNENLNEYDFWNMDIIEKVFNTRNRASDSELREKFLHGVKSMSVPFADSLNEFHDNMAIYLNVEVKKVKSLYQMFKRENVDIEFLGGRLVYLGD
jgi:hypothetical protein